MVMHSCKHSQAALHGCVLCKCRVCDVLAVGVFYVPLCSMLQHVVLSMQVDGLVDP